MPAATWCMLEGRSARFGSLVPAAGLFAYIKGPSLPSFHRLDIRFVTSVLAPACDLQPIHRRRSLQKCCAFRVLQPCCSLEAQTWQALSMAMAFCTTLKRRSAIALIRSCSNAGLGNCPLQLCYSSPRQRKTMEAGTGIVCWISQTTAATQCSGLQYCS